MFTRVTIQGSLVALQQHIRAKGPTAPNRDRSHSLDDTTTLDQRPIAVSEHNSQLPFSQYAGPQPVAVDYFGWAGAGAASPTPTKGAPKSSEAQIATCEESPAEVVLSTYDCVEDSAPTATYSYGTRDAVVSNICSFLELWVNSFKSTGAASSNPHGWECLRRQRAVAPSCQSNSCNNYNTAHASCGHALHYVYGTTIPTISMKDYLMRLTEYFRTSDAVFILAAHYFSRVVRGYGRQDESSPIVTPWSLHRVYFTCCVLAAKWLEDTPFDNQYYASVGGISTFELSKVETALLSILDFNVFVSREAVDMTWEGLQHIGSNIPITSQEESVLELPRMQSSSASQMSSLSTISSSHLSVSAAPYKPSLTQAGVTPNWYRAPSGPVFNYQSSYGHGVYNYGQQYVSIAGTY